MFQLCLAMISPEMVPAKHFFLEELISKPMIYGIRGLVIVGGVGALVIYYIMKSRKGD